MEYRRKRKFVDTPEPAGRVRMSRHNGHHFVIQKHDATNLHYDFRLEINGVLASWDIPKEPSLNPADKRLAIRTEDHPLEYSDFEGIIPEEQYGAGTVMVWDKGTYDVADNLSVEEQLAKGAIKVDLHGHKLRGKFALVQTGKRASNTAQNNRWLLIKHRDEGAEQSGNFEKSDFARSVLTGRTLKEIAQGRTARKMGERKKRLAAAH
jgi:bifunctional non-homologous end joining protein LigD